MAPVPVDSRSPLLAPGDVVAGRFRVVRLLGRGGMGEVYEAEDLTLRERVALKTLRSVAAGDAGATERLLREVQLARQVTHPNVCRIFDVFSHQHPGGSQTVVSMELLAGQTLGERLRSAGRLAPEQALPILRQVVAGLAAAHRAGVVHRDLKTDNVSLVASPHDEGGLRAVVTDFGLARGRDAGRSDLLAGTPAYMAPEQLDAREVTAASDIYALGVVMYEAVTGRLPFPGEGLDAARRRLREPPPSPRSHVPDLDPRWELAILRCLEKDPIDRFAAVADVLRALEGEPVTPSRRALVARHTRERARRRWGTALGVLVLLAAVAGAVAFWPIPKPAAPPVAEARPRRSVAILGFKNSSGRAEAAWLSTALSEMLAMELASGEQLRIVPGEAVARTKIELAIPDTDALTEPTLGKLRRNLGSDLVVLGSYFAAGKDGGGTLRLDLRLQDTAGGRMVAAVSDTGTEGELLDLVARTGARLRETLQVAEGGAPAGMRAAAPANREATRFYAEGIARLRVFDALAARDLLEKAVAADPRSPLAHSALAEAWSVLGYDQRAKDEAKKAFDSSSGLGRAERLFVAGRYYEAARQWDKAIDTYRSLAGFFPDNVEYGLRLAAAQSISGKGKDALATVEALRKLPAPARDDPRIDLAEAEAAEALGSLKQQQTAAGRAADKAARLEASLLTARARLAEGWATVQLGNPEKGLLAFGAARKFYAELGDRAGVARAGMQIARAQWQQGQLEASRATATEALLMAREVGDQWVVLRALNSIAIVASEQGRTDEARRLHEQALTIAREVGDKERERVALNNIGDVLEREGDLPGARRTYEAFLALARETGDRKGHAIGALNIGDVSRAQGDIVGAQAAYQEAQAVSLEIGFRQIVGSSAYGLGEVALAADDLPEARRRHEQGLSVRRETGQKGRAAESLLALAVVTVEEGRPAEAEKSIREALATFESEKKTVAAALAQAALARSLLAQGRADKAREAVERASALASKTQSRSVRLAVGIAQGATQSAVGEHGDAIRTLEGVTRAARNGGFLGLELEARLALGEAEISASRAAAARTRLEALAAEAEQKGFQRIARKARKALS